MSTRTVQSSPISVQLRGIGLWGRGNGLEGRVACRLNLNPREVEATGLCPKAISAIVMQRFGCVARLPLRIVFSP